jgi:hypothetical protein
MDGTPAAAEEEKEDREAPPEDGAAVSVTALAVIVMSVVVTDGRMADHDTDTREVRQCDSQRRDMLSTHKAARDSDNRLGNACLQCVEAIIYASESFLHSGIDS